MVMPIGPMAVVPHTLKTIPFDPVKDFTAIGLGATFQFALAAGPGSGAKTWAEFAAWAKANPAKASYATSAAGSLPHFVGVLLSRDIGVDMVHIAYKGSAAYINDLIGGQVPSAIDTVADLSELHRAGRIRILATTGATRAPATPDVPTFTELGLKNVVATGWFGFFAPANTPKAVIDTLNRGINKALTSPDVVERLTKLGMDPATSTPEEFATHRRLGLRQMGPDREGVGLHRGLDLGRGAHAAPVRSRRAGVRGSPGFIPQAPGNRTATPTPHGERRRIAEA